MKRDTVAISSLLLILLLMAVSCAKQSGVKQYFASQNYTFPVDFVQPSEKASQTSAADTAQPGFDTLKYLESGNAFMKKNANLKFWKKLMPKAEAFRIYSPYVSQAADTTTYDYGINVSAFGTGSLPTSHAIYVESGDVWRSDNVAQFKLEDSTWVFAGWLN